jgi:hypothetical protein
MHQKFFEQLQKGKIVCNTAMVCKKCSVIDTACMIDKRFELKAEFKKALARESGVLFDEKNRGSKIL